MLLDAASAAVLPANVVMPGRRADRAVRGMAGHGAGGGAEHVSGESALWRACSYYSEAVTIQLGGIARFATLERFGS